MTTGLWLLLYGAALAWLSPSLLRRLTKSGVSPQMGVAAWLTAIATTLIAWVIAVVLIGVAAIDGVLGTSAVTLCLELFGLSEHGGTTRPQRFHRVDDRWHRFVRHLLGQNQSVGHATEVAKPGARQCRAAGGSADHAPRRCHRRCPEIGGLLRVRAPSRNRGNQCCLVVIGPLRARGRPGA